jgi:hypothetical protein
VGREEDDNIFLLVGRILADLGLDALSDSLVEETGD